MDRAATKMITRSWEQKALLCTGLFLFTFPVLPLQASAHGPGSMGLGMVSPALVPRVLYFYEPPDLLAVTGFPEPIDSVVFVQGKHHVEIASAPNWFMPVHMKLDYDLLLLRAVTVSQNWIEVEVNTIDGRTTWLHNLDLQFINWEQFILGAVTVEVLDAERNPIRAGATADASLLAMVGDKHLRPVAVQGDWLLVTGYQDEEGAIPTGWVRWREGEKLLVEYSLLC